MLRKLFSQGSRLRGIAAISGGTIFGQAILIGATPVLSRMYPPEAFGAFSTLISIVSIVGSVAALRYDTGIVLPEKEQDAATILRLALLSAGVVSFASGMILWGIEGLGFGEAWSGVAFAPVWAAGLSFFSALATILVQVALRGRAYGLIGKRAPIQSTATALGQLGLGLMTPTPIGLLGGTAIGNVSGLAPMARMTLRLLAVDRNDLRKVAKTYWRIPVILAPSALMNSLGAQLPLLAIAGLYGSAIVGEFGMVQRLVYIPATLVGTAVAQVFAAELAKHLREGGKGATRIYLRSSALLAAVAAPVTLLIAILGPLVLPTVLGSGWTMVAEFCAPLALVMGVSLVASPTSQVYTIFQSVASLVMDLSRILLLLAAIMICVNFDLDAVEATWALVVAQTINYAATWLYGIKVTRQEMR